MVIIQPPTTNEEQQCRRRRRRRCPLHRDFRHHHSSSFVVDIRRKYRSHSQPATNHQPPTTNADREPTLSLPLSSASALFVVAVFISFATFVTVLRHRYRRRCSLVVHWSLFVCRCSLFVVRCSSFVVRRSLFVFRRSSSVVRRSSFVVRRSSFVVRRSSFVCRLSFVVRLSFAVCRSLFVVRRSSFVRFVCRTSKRCLTSKPVLAVRRSTLRSRRHYFHHSTSTESTAEDIGRENV